jgi:putative transposase
MKLAPQEIRTYFITAVCAGRRRVFQTTANASLMIEVMQTNRAKGRMQIHAFALMPDHMHLVLTPAPDVSLEKSMPFLKGGYSFLLKSKLDIWERSYRERRIIDAEDFVIAKRYVELNPVRAGIVQRAEEFEFCSACRDQLLDPTPPWFGMDPPGLKPLPC